MGRSIVLAGTFTGIFPLTAIVPGSGVGIANEDQRVQLFNLIITTCIGIVELMSEKLGPVKPDVAGVWVCVDLAGFLGSSEPPNGKPVDEVDDASGTI